MSSWVSDELAQRLARGLRIPMSVIDGRPWVPREDESPLELCDLHHLGAEPDCPGIANHCIAGDHCVGTAAECAAAANVGDHPSRCCTCGATTFMVEAP